LELLIIKMDTQNQLLKDFRDDFLNKHFTADTSLEEIADYYCDYLKRAFEL
jgi:predicted DNA-binding protein YlxM (UPF0122 family)